MELKRIFEIINSNEIKDIYYMDNPVWVQELNNNTAKVGFLNGNIEKDVFISDLYEDNLYNK